MNPERFQSLLLAAAVALAAPQIGNAAAAFTTDFSPEKCKWAANGRNNPYFSLQPGDQIVLAGDDDGEEVEVEITVLGATRDIAFTTADGKVVALTARIVQEREWIDGELVEISRNFYARCAGTNDVFYFGEEVDIYEDGVIVSHDGAWEAGHNGALPGIIVPARFLLGARYFQEIAEADEALDRAHHVAMNLTKTLAGKTWRGCVRIIETSPLEPGHESLKEYCPGLGLVTDNAAVLVDYHRE